MIYNIPFFFASRGKKENVQWGIRMKYLTKEWYESAQKPHICFSLKISKKAENFSEEYFEKLYKIKETEHVNLIKKGFDIKFEDIFPEEPRGEFIIQSEEAKKAYFEQREQARIKFANRPVFSPAHAEQARKNFKQLHNKKIDNLKKNLPESILQKVADIRVLALDVSSAEVKREINKYCKQNEKLVNSSIKAYQKQYEKQFKINEPDFAEDLAGLHDAKIISCRRKRNDIVWTIDVAGSFTDVSKIRMINCKVIKQDTPLHGARYMYDEIYKSGKGYELHFLLWKKKLIDFIVYTDDIECFYD